MERISKLQYGIIITLTIFAASSVVSFSILNNYYQEADLPTVEGEELPERAPFVPRNRNLAIGIGVSMGLVAFAMWQGSEKIQQDAISIMIHRGLEDLTVRDLEIVRRIMKKEQFTIPELKKHTSVSRQSIWRLVKKLEEKELIKESGKKRLPSSGRGKPSQVYEYIGP